MVKFSEFAYSWTYQVAAGTRERIFGEDSLVDIREFFTADSYFREKALSASRETFLHQFIQQCIEADVDWCISKLDYDEYLGEELCPLLTAYKIRYPKISSFSLPPGEHKEDKKYLWAHHLQDIFVAQAAPKLTQEVFTLMFQDRDALREFNGHIANLIKGLKVADYPDLLSADGKVKRQTYWPTWLKNGLIYRDKGRCAICLTDLSGVIAAGVDIAIDHIVPINLGGTNDPTNLQILCKDCNEKKSGNKSSTSRYQHLYWDMKD